MTEVTPMIHLTCGSTGAGKTTFAADLCKKHKAVIFSIDDWMVTLFGKDLPSSSDWQWISERAARCETQILTTALNLASIGVQSVLDIGLLQADRRCAVTGTIQSAGYASRLYFLDVTADERWLRVQQRNSQRGETFHMKVTRLMFDFIETIWEPPTPIELEALNGTTIHG